MPNYDILVNWTEQGIKNVKDSVRRSEAFETAIENAGGKSIGLYYTLGKHDMVAVVEAPNESDSVSLISYWKPRQCKY
jgi:uncharacterized protein with GYD domain